MFVFNVPPTAKVIWRRGHGLKSYPTDWRSRESNLRPLVYNASGLSTTPQQLLLTLVFYIRQTSIVDSVTFSISVVSDLSRRHSNHKPQRFDSLIECKLNDGNSQFHFSQLKISNFRHKLAFKEVVRFLSPSVYNIFHLTQTNI